MSRTAQSMIVSVKAEEVELDEPDLLDVVLVELGHDARAAGLAVERGEVRQRGRRDDDAARMGAGIAREPLEPLREIDQVAHLVLGAVAARGLGLLIEASSSVMPSSNGISFATRRRSRKAGPARGRRRERPRARRASRT